jgi:hypothetical protein
VVEPRFVASPRSAAQPGADRIERFRAWIEEYATALETGDFGALDRLFAIEATYRPGPFSAVLRGRRAIRGYLESLLGDRPSFAVTARALGVGSTYAIAHWVNGWRDGDADAVEDGILLAAFDTFGRCTSLRAWAVAGGTEP